MDAHSAAKTGGTVLSALGTAAFTATDTAQVFGIENKWLGLLSFGVFCVFVAWIWYDQNKRISGLTRAKPKVGITLRQRDPDWFLDIRNDGEAADFTVIADVCAVHGSNVVIPNPGQEIELDTRRIMRGGQTSVHFAHYQVRTDTRLTIMTVFPETFWNYGANRRGQFDVVAPGSECRNAEIEIRFVTEPSVDGPVTTRRYRVWVEPGEMAQGVPVLLRRIEEVIPQTTPSR